VIARLWHQLVCAVKDHRVYFGGLCFRCGKIVQQWQGGGRRYPHSAAPAPRSTPTRPGIGVPQARPTCQPGRPKTRPAGAFRRPAMDQC